MFLGSSLVLIFFLFIIFKLNVLDPTEAKRSSEYVLPYPTAIAMAIAYCIRNLLSPHSFTLGMKRQILPDHVTANHTLPVLMVLLQTYISTKELGFRFFHTVPRFLFFVDSNGIIHGLPSRVLQGISGLLLKLKKL